jgi:tryptophan synthase alpha chain
MSRLPAMFERLRVERRTGLIAYVTAGYPTPAETVPLVRALLEGGADAVELGVPFSDPLADGATVQRSTFVALEQGVTPAAVLAMVRELRDAGIDAPLLTMGYVNPLIAYGLERFGVDAAAAGLDGMICVDLPPEEAEPVRAMCRANGMDLIFLVAPTSTDERLARVAALAGGFVYCVSVTGTTGARASISAELPAFIARVRQHTDLPLAVGFGVSRPEHVAQIGQLCEAAVIGSAIIESIDRAPPEQRAESVRTYVEVVTGRQRV